MSVGISKTKEGVQALRTLSSSLDQEVECTVHASTALQAAYEESGKGLAHSLEIARILEEISSIQKKAVISLNTLSQRTAKLADDLEAFLDRKLGGAGGGGGAAAPKGGSAGAAGRYSAWPGNGKKNKIAGVHREEQVEKELESLYPSNAGYEIIKEAYLRDSAGKIVRDPETGTGRRIDFEVIRDGQVVDSVEVTSMTADKTKQLEKEQRVMDAGGTYIRTEDGTLIKFSPRIHTRVMRKE